MKPCPDHPRTLGATLNQCRACDAEKVTPERAHELATAARAALTRTVSHHHPQPAVTDLSAARTAIDNAKEA